MIEDCDAFQVISIGPAPVSDGRPKKMGVQAFIDGLSDAGYGPEVVTGKPDHVAFAYVVPTGKFAGKAVHIGLVVPPDFPATSPGGIHVTPRVHAHKDGGTHPTGGVQNSSFERHRGQEWQYWSRPFPEWGKSAKTVKAYLSHLWKLWDTQ